MISKCISFLVLLFSWPVGGEGGEADLSGYQNFKMLPTIDTFLNKSYRGEGPWGLSEDRFSKEANRNPLHHSEGKVNFQSLRALSHKKKTAEETWVSINMTSFLEFWSSESSPHLSLTFNFMATRWLQKSSAVLPEAIKHDNNTALTLSWETWASLEFEILLFFHHFFINYRHWPIFSFLASLGEFRWLSCLKVFSPA